MRRFTIADLLNEDKNKKLENECKELEREKVKEKDVVYKKKLDNHDNQARLNQWGQEGSRFLEWGVEPEE